MEVEENSEIEKLTITGSEWAALNEIRGLEQRVFYMVIAATKEKNGNFVLEGRTEVFDALSRDVFEEIYSKLSPPRVLAHLKKLYRKLEPDGEY